MKSQLATFRAVAYGPLTKRLPNKAAVLHTNGAGVPPDGSLFDWWSKVAAGKVPKVGPHTGAHFQVTKTGSIEQYVDTDFSIGHAWDANPFAIGIETEDDGHPATPWTDQQLDAIVALLVELGVPGQLLQEGPSDGIGYHQLFSSWNQSGHNCPGPVRVKQIMDIVIPRVQEGGMGKADEYFQQLEDDGLSPAQYSAFVRFVWGYQRGVRQKPLDASSAQDDVTKAGFDRGTRDAPSSTTSPGQSTPPT